MLLRKSGKVSAFGDSTLFFPVHEVMTRTLNAEPLPEVRLPLNLREGTMVVNALVVDRLDTEPPHPGIVLQASGHVSDHVLDEHWVIVGLHRDMAFVLTLEQRIYRRGGRRLGDLDELLDPDQVGRPFVFGSLRTSMEM